MATENFFCPASVRPGHSVIAYCTTQIPMISFGCARHSAQTTRAAGTPSRIQRGIDMLDALSTIKFFKLAPIEDAQLVLDIVTDLVRGRNTSAPPTTARSAARLPRESRPGPEDSIRSKALQVLRERGSPMGGTDLQDAINRRFSSTYSKATVVGQLARLVRHGDTFVRPEKGQYGLLEWQKAEVPHDRRAVPTPTTAGA